MLFVRDGAIASPPESRALFGARTRLESVLLSEVAPRTDLRTFRAAFIDCPVSPVAEVVSIAHAVAAEAVPVVLALFETDLHAAEERTFRAAHPVVVRPYRDAQLAAALRCAIAPSLARPSLAAVVDAFALSRREAGILEELMRGGRVPALAGKLGLSAHTVRNHLKAVFRKCGVHSQVELVALAKRLTSGG